MMNLMNYATAANAAINNNRRGDNYEQFCVSWLPDGRAFVVYDIKEFTSKVIPKFFKASKFCSFTRKRKSFYSSVILQYTVLHI
jgi:hypothetical protein